jgi:hypothetical protein
LDVAFGLQKPSAKLLNDAFYAMLCRQMKKLRRPECFDRKAFKDADFHREYKKLTGEEPDPLMPEEMEKAIRERRQEAGGR